MKKLSLALLITTTAMFIGCGGGSSSEQGNYEVLKSVNIKASDAYVVKLNSPAVAKCGDKNYTSTEVNNGEITFKLPDNANVQNCTFTIPDDAIVDTDGDGNYSDADLPIRMGLKLKGLGIANPLTTYAVEKNDQKTLEQTRNFDPVQAKIQVLNDINDTKSLNLAILSDTIADLADMAKKEGLDPNEIIKNIDVDQALINADNPDANISSVITDSILPAVSGTVLQQKIDQINKKIEEEKQLAETLHKHIKNNILNKKEALEMMIAATDGNISVKLDNNISKENIQQLMMEIKNQLKLKHNELHQEKQNVVHNKEKEEMEQNKQNVLDNMENNRTHFENMSHDMFKNNEDANENRYSNKEQNVTQYQNYEEAKKHEAYKNEFAEENNQNTLSDMIADRQEEHVNERAHEENEQNK